MGKKDEFQPNSTKQPVKKKTNFTLPSQTKMDEINNSAKKFNEAPSSQSAWKRLSAAFSSMMQGFSDWLDRLFPSADSSYPVDKPLKNGPTAPSNMSFGDSARRLRKSEENKAKKRRVVFRIAENLFGNTIESGVDKTLKTGLKLGSEALKKAADKEVVALRDTSEFKDLVKYQKFLTTDNRSHTCFGHDLKVEQKAATLLIFIVAIQLAFTMDHVDEAFVKYEEELRPILNRGQNFTTQFFAPLGMRTTTVALIDAFRERKDKIMASANHI